MIFECPKCKAAHSKPERDLGQGTAIICRRCEHEFRVSAAGKVSEIPGGGKKKAKSAAKSGPSKQPAANNVVPAPAAPKPPQTNADSGFGQVPTTQMTLEQMKNVAETAEQESVDPFTEKLDEGATTVTSGKKMRAMLDSMSSNLEPKGAEPAPAPFSADPFAKSPSGGDSLDDETGKVIVEPVAPPEPEALAKPVPLEEERPQPKAPAAEKAPAAKKRPSQTAEVPLPGFPLETLLTYFRGLRAYLFAQSVPVKATVGAALFVVLCLLVLPIVALSGPDTYPLFAEQDGSLMAGPGTSEVYDSVASVQRGDEFLAFESGNFGSYRLVRDVMGRVGYLPTLNVGGYRPIAVPGLPFAGCRQSPIEPAIDPCQTRAQLQFDSCREVCEEDADEATCLEHCQQRLSACIGGCEGVPPEGVAGDGSPILEDPAGEGQLGDDGSRKLVPKKKKRLKKRKKRRR